MRITNKIMQRNNLSNINTNKIYQDALSTQMSTQKKINRPSDDPVVAIRALRLRSNVTEVTQYYSKNIPDAKSWLSVTEGALKNLSGVVTDMIKQCEKGSNGDLKVEDRQIILEQLKALGDEVYSTADADYAGRYVFTGYRTDTPLCFQAQTTEKYTITEQLDNSIIDQVKKINAGELMNWNSNNFNTGTIQNMTEQDISEVEVYRIRLAYDNCMDDGVAPTITYGKTSADDPGTTITSTMKHSYDVPDPYTYADQNPGELVYVPETGELLFGGDIYDELMAAKDDPSTTWDEGEIRVTYQKEEWAKGDLRPEHYFYCETDTLKYNEEYLTGDPEKQVIEYDVGFNQTIRINSTADECFQHSIGREVDNLADAMQEVLDLEGVKSNIEKKLKETTTPADIATLEKQLAAADKALTLAKDKCQRMFEKGITAFQGHLDAANLSITNCGTRSKKLELIENRMQNQKTTFETLKSENEDIDITEIVIQLTSADLTYQAALMATGKVAQTTLLNYI